MSLMTVNSDRIGILIVDDREENLLAMEGWLHDFNLNIVRAKSGHEALARVLEEDIALVLLDVQMPGMDGFETAKLMHGAKCSRNIPIIFVTAFSKEETHVIKGYESGGVDYLFKPFDPNILRDKVAVFVNLYEQKQIVQKNDADLKKTLARVRRSPFGF